MAFCQWTTLSGSIKSVAPEAVAAGAETAGGYARELAEDQQRRVLEVVAGHAAGCGRVARVRVAGCALRREGAGRAEAGRGARRDAANVRWMLFINNWAKWRSTTKPLAYCNRPSRSVSTQAWVVSPGTNCGSTAAAQWPGSAGSVAALICAVGDIWRVYRMARDALLTPHFFGG